ncbi:MAG: hypothetical protein U9Q90_03045 [Campylobacterota bacterium]|nr:hypothetical protein [Campylobacterota bacterium]
MKNSLGDIVIRLFIILFSMSLVSAEDFTYKFTLDKENPYVKEPVIMTLDLVQTNHDKVMLFKFTPRQSKDYEFHRLDIKEEDAYHAAKVHYTYLIYPLRSGDINITFDLIEMVTTDEKVAFSFSGDRDNVRGLNKTDIPINLPPLKLKVKALPKGTLLVGDFALSHTIKKHEAKAHEPLSFTVTVKGKGYPPILNSIIPDKGNYTIFKEKPVVKSVKSQKGTINTVTYPIALSAKQSFELDPVKIKAFDPQREKSYELTIPGQDFAISQPDLTTLVDQIDSPRPIHTDWSRLVTLLGYIVVFIAGFLTAKSVQWRPKMVPGTIENDLAEKIKSIDDPKELLALLMATDVKRYKAVIEKLESSLYGKKKISLSSIKKELLQENIIDANQMEENR